MRPLTQTLIVLTLAALPLAGAGSVVMSERPVVKELPLDMAGSFWVDNPNGNIEIIGVEGSMATVTATRTIIAADAATAKDLRNKTSIKFDGDDHLRLVSTVIPPPIDRRACMVNYIIQVPRTVHVQVASKSAQKIHISNVMGNVTVNAFNGAITLDNVSGASVINTVNGFVTYNYASKPVSNAQITAINASLELHMPSDSSFEWAGESLRGDFVTTFKPRVRFTGPMSRAFRASVNAGGPLFSTVTMMGRVAMLANGTKSGDARNIYQQQLVDFPADPMDCLDCPTLIRHINLPIVAHDLDYNVGVADLFIGEVRGTAKVQARAGTLQLDRVLGECEIYTLGGPLILGEITHRLTAHTGAGDITVRAAREGGTISTEGGLIRVAYTGGPTRLVSGGGDIVLRQALGPISAETRSGDITISMDPSQKTQHIEAKTLRGNIVLNLPPAFGADVDATVITSDPDAEAIRSDFNGLSIRREQVGPKTRVRASGKINGGGERIEIFSYEGNIHLSSAPGR